MSTVILIADSGATKTKWSLIGSGKKKDHFNTGNQPLFFKYRSDNRIKQGIKTKTRKCRSGKCVLLWSRVSNPVNAKSVKKALTNVIKKAKIEVTHDLMAAARALCGQIKGWLVFCWVQDLTLVIMTEKKLVKNSPGLGYVLGDEGSGAYLGKKVIQYYLYGTFNDELRGRFDLTYTTNKAEILENVYKKPLPNRYLASYARFLADNRGHYMIENIIEDGLNEFFLIIYANTGKHGHCPFILREVLHLVLRMSYSNFAIVMSLN